MAAMCSIFIMSPYTGEEQRMIYVQMYKFTKVIDQQIIEHGKNPVQEECIDMQINIIQFLLKMICIILFLLLCDIILLMRKHWRENSFALTTTKTIINDKVIIKKNEIIKVRSNNEEYIGSSSIITEYIGQTNVVVVVENDNYGDGYRHRYYYFDRIDSVEIKDYFKARG